MTGGDELPGVRAFVGHVERAITGGRELVLAWPTMSQVIAALALLARAGWSFLSAARKRVSAVPSAAGASEVSGARSASR